MPLRLPPRAIAAGLALTALAVPGLAQSFNIDLDTRAGSQEAGSGPPSSAFGGAAGISGEWNALSAVGWTIPRALVDLQGNSTAATILSTGGVGSAGGYNNHLNTGDFALLLNDFADVLGANEEIDYLFAGFQPGDYLIYTYAVRAGPPFDYNAYVTVPGSTEGTQVVTGPMPGDQFILGVTHCVHHLHLNGDAFQINVHGTGWPNAECNGLQIVAVPEPGSLLALGLGAGMMTLKRRSKM